MPGRGSVNNPNYFGVNIKSLDLDVRTPPSSFVRRRAHASHPQIKYPVNNTDFGGGSARDIVFGANSAREFDFPFAIKYKPADDPQQHVLADLATKCGVIPGSTKSDLTINYKIDLALSILGVTVRPSVSNSFKFACPDITAQMAVRAAASAARRAVLMRAGPAGGAEGRGPRSADDLQGLELVGRLSRSRWLSWTSACFHMDTSLAWCNYRTDGRLRFLRQQKNNSSGGTER
jgi:hypothetical protein